MEAEQPALPPTQPPTKFVFVITHKGEFDRASRKIATAHATSWSRARQREAAKGSAAGHARRRVPTSSSTSSKRLQDPDARIGAVRQCRPTVELTVADNAVLMHHLSVARRQDLHFISPSFDVVGHMPQLFDDSRGYSALAGLQGHVRRVLATMRTHDANTDGRNPTMFAADVLSACAQHSTMTGAIRPIELLALKAHIIEQVQRDIQSPEATSVSTINAIMALGTWVVSLENGIGRPSSAAETKRSVGVGESPVSKTVTAYNLPHRDVVLALIARRGGARTMLDSTIARTMLTFLIL